MRSPVTGKLRPLRTRALEVAISLASQQVLLGLLSLSLFLSAFLRPLRAAGPLASVEELRAVSSWSEEELHPLALQGVVTLVDESRHLLVLQDGHSALGLDVGDYPLRVSAGDLVLVKARDCHPFFQPLPRYPELPDKRELLTQFEYVAPRLGAYYVDRFRGFLEPRVTGYYRLFIASDDSSQLLLGSDERPQTRRIIAEVNSYTRQRDWGRTEAQHSEPLLLEAGHRYFVESVHQQSQGEAHLSVAWEGPGLPLSLIDGSFLSAWPVEVPANQAETSSLKSQRGCILRETWLDASVDAARLLTAPRKLGALLSVSGCSVQRIGRGELPQAVSSSSVQASDVSGDWLWFQQEGLVEFVSVEANRITLDVSEGGRHLDVVILGPHENPLPRFLGRRIRARGVAEGLWANSDQRRVGRLWLSSLAFLQVLDQAPVPQLSRSLTLQELVHAEPTEFQGQGVHVIGRIVEQSGQLVTLQDAGTIAASYSKDGQHWIPLGHPLEISMPTKLLAGLAVNSRRRDKASLATFSEVQGQSSELSCVNVGNAELGGTFSRQGQRIEISGRGGDIWDAPDQFTFVCQPWEGEGALIARLDAFEPADPNARAGLMLRESSDPVSQFVDLICTAESGEPSLSFQWRWHQEGRSTRALSIKKPEPGAPLWLKLERAYNHVLVRSSEPVRFKTGEHVEATGYVSSTGGQLLISDALISAYQANPSVLDEEQSWRPLKEIAQLSAPGPRWAGLDYFRIRGVVTFCSEVLGRRYWAVQDRSGGTLLFAREPSAIFEPPVGSFVEVCSSPGWAPPSDQLIADNVFVLGQAVFPQALRHPAEYLLPHRGEGTWTELEGIIRASSPAGLLQLKTGGEVFAVALGDRKGFEPEQWLDAEIRVRGVVAYPNEHERLLLVPSLAQMELLTPVAKASGFEGPQEAIGHFSSATLLNQSRHRVHLRGVVTLVQGSRLYLQDETGVARVETFSPSFIKLGEAAEVVGFPDWSDDNGLLIREALVRPAPGVTASPLKPLPLASSMSPIRPFSLVQLRAEVLRKVDAEEGTVLELFDAGGVFSVQWPGNRQLLEEVPEGTQVQVSGVALTSSGFALQAESAGANKVRPELRLLLRQPSDLVLLRKPSWWVLKRTLWIITLSAAIVFVTLFWIHRLRERVRQRTQELAQAMGKLEKETRMAATLAERDRLAGEIHDSLEQGLNGMVFHLQSMASLPDCPDSVRANLDLACKMASFSRTEVQHAVWELQSPLLESSSLPAAVESLARQVTTGRLALQFSVDGRIRSLGGPVEHHLLRVVQEALNNVLKHASARQVELTIVYEANCVELRVKDDGCGFVPEAVSTGGLGHFGLRSLRTRVGRIGAQLVLRSAPGQGTLLCVRVPHSEPSHV